jgi:hypothetical protein
MNHASNAFAALVQQAGRGDAEARTQMERDLTPIVRRVIQNGAGTSHLDRRILDEARHCEAGAQADQDQLVRRVAQSLCLSVIAQLRPAASGARLTAETIASSAKPDRRRSA